MLTPAHVGKLQAEKSHFWCLSHISAAAPWSVCPVHSSFSWTVNLPPRVYSLVHHLHTPLSSPHPSTHQVICQLVVLPVCLYFLSGRCPICLSLCLFSVQQVHKPACRPHLWSRSYFRALDFRLSARWFLKKLYGFTIEGYFTNKTCNMQFTSACKNFRKQRLDISEYTFKQNWKDWKKPLSEVFVTTSNVPTLLFSGSFLKITKSLRYFNIILSQMQVRHW